MAEQLPVVITVAAIRSIEPIQQPVWWRLPKQYGQTAEKNSRVLAHKFKAHEPSSSTKQLQRWLEPSYETN
jgi:hypothetical protein